MTKTILFASIFLLFVGLTLNSCKKDEEVEPALTGLDAAKKDYDDNYLGTKAIPIGWTGATSGCLAGSISQTVQNNVIKRVNYYRRLVGLPDNVTLNSSQNQKCQEAALYMVANRTITHYPSAGGTCYTAGAADAAGHGNLAVSNGYSELDANHSVNAVSGYIEDPGANNLAVGHRAWILFPQLSAMGTGSAFNPADNNWTANCLMWGDNMTGAAPAIDFVAYPPANYIASSLLFPRWSFSIQGADFNGATVSMTNASGANIQCNVIHKSASTGGAPDARIAWEPDPSMTGNITGDTEFNVTVSNIGGITKTSYSYTVKVFYVTSTAKRIASQEGFKEFLSL